SIFCHPRYGRYSRTASWLFGMLTRSQFETMFKSRIMLIRRWPERKPAIATMFTTAMFTTAMVTTASRQARV
ncbi:hypothetical protein, partial [Endozoicomonas sp. ONNA2]|uniref:hypothetical protein n=1 Tax=Endozoicomonas sp. ONNA2 TaxID=2828741 RepID=UPI002148803C